MLWPRFWTPWVELGDRRRPLRARDRAARTRSSGTSGPRRPPTARQSERAQRQRVLPVRPLPARRSLVSGPGHDGRLLEGPAAHAAAQPAGVAAAAPHDPLDPDALGHLPARARVGAGQHATRRTAPKLGGHRDARGSLASARSVPVLDLAFRGRPAARSRWLHEAEGARQRRLARQARRRTRGSTSASSARATCSPCGAAGGTTWGEPGFERSFAVGGYPGREPLRHRAHERRRSCAATPTTRSPAGATPPSNARVPLPALLAAARLALGAALPAPLPRHALLRRRERVVEGVPGRRPQDRGRRLARRRLRARLRAAATAELTVAHGFARAGRHARLPEVRAGVLTPGRISMRHRPAGRGDAWSRSVPERLSSVVSVVPCARPEPSRCLSSARGGDLLPGGPRGLLPSVRALA